MILHGVICAFDGFTLEVQHDMMAPWAFPQNGFELKTSDAARAWRVSLSSCAWKQRRRRSALRL